MFSMFHHVTGDIDHEISNRSQSDDGRDNKTMSIEKADPNMSILLEVNRLSLMICIK